MHIITCFGVLGESPCSHLPYSQNNKQERMFASSKKDRLFSEKGSKLLRRVTHGPHAPIRIMILWSWMVDRQAAKSKIRHVVVISGLTKTN